MRVAGWEGGFFLDEVVVFFFWCVSFIFWSFLSRKKVSERIIFLFIFIHEYIEACLESEAFASCEARQKLNFRAFFFISERKNKEWKEKAFFLSIIS